MKGAASCVTRADRKVALAVFLVAAGVYGLVFSGHIYLLDASFKLVWAENLANYGQLYFDRYQIGNPNRIGTYFYVGRNGNLYIHFPLGGLFCFLPAAYLGRLVEWVWPAAGQAHVAYYLAALTNVPSAAGAAALLFLLSRQLGLGRRQAVAAALALAFATPLFPYATYDFNEPVAAAFVLLSCSILIVNWDRRGLRAPAAAGAVLGLAFVIRYELLAFAAAAVLLYAVLAGLKKARWLEVVVYAGAFTAVGAVVPLWNWYARGAPNNFAYNTLPFFVNLLRVRFKPLQGGGPLLFAARFVWVYFLSPNMHNVILYSPLILFGAFGAGTLVRRWGARMLFLVVPSLVLGAAVIFTSYSSWAWGLRYAFIFWIILSAAGILAPKYKKWQRAAYKICIAWGVLLGVSATLADYQLTQNDIAVAVIGDPTQVNYRGWIPKGRMDPRYAQIPWHFKYTALAAARTVDFYVHGGRLRWTRLAPNFSADLEGNLLDIWPVYADVSGPAPAGAIWAAYGLLAVATAAAVRWLWRLAREYP